MAPSWYVLQSKPHKENQVYNYLTAQGYEIFYPTMRIKPVNPRSSKVRPYFPRYMFVHVDLEAVGLSALQWVPGAIGLVKFDDYVAPVPDNVVYDIQQQISVLEAVQADLAGQFKPGDQLRITSGPLAGYEAIFDKRLSGTERVQVLLQMVDSLVRVQINAGEIQLIQ